MTDLTSLASTEVVGLAIGIPVAVVAVGTGIGLRLRKRRGAAPTPVASPPVAPPPVAPPRADKPPVAAEVPAGTDLEGAAEPAAEEPPTGTATPSAAAAPATFRDRMGKARGLLAGYLGSVRSRQKVDGSTWDDLEEALIRADVGVGATDALLADLRSRVKAGTISGVEELIDALKEDLVSALATPKAALDVPEPGGALPVVRNGPDGSNGDGESERAVAVWLFVGVNGVGKTTTVGKVANRLTQGGTTVLLAAGDTFRAAAGEQLELWAQRSGADIVRGGEGGDPSSVVFDAVQRAASRGYQLVLADTAGRLHNKVNLVEELKKIRRVADRAPGTVTEVLLVLDATTGQNGLAQAKVFLEAVEVTGVVLTKLDGTAKGGIVVAIQRELGLPVKLVGLGEGVEDLVDFDPVAFVDALF